ncbi:MAG: Flp pilus assembly protein CpaB [Steroidobacteraceae bacterium]
MQLHFERWIPRQEWLAWLIAGAGAIATGFAMRAWLEARSAEATAKVEARYRPTSVVVAREDLAPGVELTATRLAVRAMPADFLPASTVTQAHASELIGRTVQHAVRAGEPIQTSLLRVRTPERLAERIALGRRAVTIVVDEAAAAAGLMAPGDRVDLLWRDGITPPLENVPIIATGRQYLAVAGKDADHEYATLTLELADGDARRVASSDTGALRVLLRNPSDTNSLALPAASRRSRPLPSIALFVGGSGGPTPMVHRLQAGAR